MAPGRHVLLLGPLPSFPKCHVQGEPCAVLEEASRGKSFPPHLGSAGPPTAFPRPPWFCSLGRQRERWHRALPAALATQSSWEGGRACPSLITAEPLVHSESSPEAI